MEEGGRGEGGVGGVGVGCMEEGGVMGCGCG